jgi:hypothetical protein
MKTASFFLRAIVLLVVSNSVVLAQSTTTVWHEPVGAVSEYRLRGGGQIIDSVMSTSGRNLYVLRTTRQGSTKTETVRNFYLGLGGASLVDEFGQQLLFPVPWPPKVEWSYSYRGSAYRYTPIGMEEVATAIGTLRALHVQLTVQTNATARAVDLWMQPNLEIIKRATRPSSSDNDYELISRIAPRLPTIIEQTRREPVVGTARPQAQQEHRGSTTVRQPDFEGSHWFVGASIGAAYSPPFATPTYLDSAVIPLGVVEFGNRGDVLGWRIRYGVKAEEFEEGSEPLQLGSVDLTLSTSAKRRVSLFISGGATGTNGGRQVGESPFHVYPSAGIGAAIGMNRNFAVIIDGTFAYGAIQRFVGATSTEWATTGIFNFGLRYH